MIKLEVYQGRRGKGTNGFGSFGLRNYGQCTQTVRSKIFVPKYFS